MPNFSIKNMDAFDFLGELPKASAHLIVSSPPYFMGKEYDRSKDVRDFVSDHERLLPLLLECLKPGGSICWQVGNHVANGVVTPLDALVFAAFQSDELQLRNRIVWTFGHGAHARSRFSGRHETILWFTKGDDYHFDLDAVRVPQQYPGKKHYKGPKRGQWSGNPKGKNPTDVWEIPNVKANHVEKLDHPCQFPVALAQRLIRALAPAKGIVVDPFAGTASTGIAAILERRSFWGCDYDLRYVKIALSRYKSLLAGDLQVRPLNKPTYSPKPGTQLTTSPFLATGA